ncbi:DUF72 domain-containing protein [Halalkalibacterium halodurans]|jgi:uncharacterized protein YecE (DUF72 family)|uniref:DUF72 domain-containing protein n=1 Tax=Halalkalibacterium halodurans TaxID=86665 RepID=UPI002E1B4D08|nr:DUF72 domain-containing protein [Halalkalibacterium halodurans]MED4083364.1 DUF72 domain-containing protein [Halalkalibacterium halodurans]MED4105106.1 DUF72 domain-containing protein [Halalkalibacterium halodurans]MED4109424.1 DUF72 domain-containing protein [Halalkalibacterium halodurans]MED4124232.1 DUF72 domain-containing protein [Halalkalibacterium halodurans]
MIYIGLTGWGDHDELYTMGTKPSEKLYTYGSYFPAVEVDSSFYAIQPKRNMEKWASDTPDCFRFVVKAYQGLTGHQRGEIPFSSKEDMFAAFVESLQPLLESNKLAMVLFQFPPWFDCTKEHVRYLRYCKQLMGQLPVALEFRHQSWFRPSVRERTLAFMREEGWIHSICDEPQAGEGSVPTVLVPSNEENVLVRFHGRNVEGWRRPQEGNWREVRYLYRYSKEELAEWAEHLKQLAAQVKDVYVLFNNNSGGDAAANAKQMLELLEIEYHGLTPKQLNLFE